MDLETFKKAQELDRKIKGVNKVLFDLEASFDVAIRGQYQGTLEPELVRECKLFFKREFEERLNSLAEEFDNL